MNVLHGKVEGPGRGPDELTVAADSGERWQVRAAGSPGLPISIGVRPESLQLSPGAETAEAWNSLKGTVTEVVYLGAVVRYQMKVTEGLSVTAEIHNPDFSAICEVGDPLTLWFSPSRAVPLPDEMGSA
jgi:ABC-type Fe3+/spermidine/putrescine transport system ATPase subunit